VTAWSGSQSMGLGVAVVFFLIGLCVMLTVRAPNDS
jgi:MFS-type transporter involved in bile tolerance (Atg22 family)